MKESKYCSDVIKKHFTKNLWWLMKILKTLLDVGLAEMIIFIMMLKKKTIVPSLENIEALHIEILVSLLNWIASSCRISKPKKKWYQSYYTRSRQSQSYNKCHTKVIREMYELYHLQ